MNKLTDDDPMPFGVKHKGIPMKDVPVGYLHWIWENVSPYNETTKAVREYIYENLHVLKEENEDLIWSKP
jgi:hypothetical protein